MLQVDVMILFLKLNLHIDRAESLLYPNTPKPSMSRVWQVLLLSPVYMLFDQQAPDVTEVRIAEQSMAKWSPGTLQHLMKKKR